jgi:Glycosyl transferase family 11
MILLENAGGLGNQLFIWTAAHQLLDRRSERVLILTPRRSNRSNELGELSSFCSHNIKVLETDLYFKMIRLLERIERNLFPGKFLSRFLRISTLQNPTARIESIDSRAKIIRGYFQYSDLVTSNSEVVLDEIKTVTNNKFVDISSRIHLPSNYQLFHIRRGDYLQNQDTLGVLSDEYFIGQRDGNCPLVICTENQSDLTDNMAATKIIDKSSASTWETLALMAQSSKLVISNSTLSWWGGILAIRENDSVEISCPEPWTKTSNSPKDYLKIARFNYKKADFL